jgi:hypothetical protein
MPGSRLRSAGGRSRCHRRGTRGCCCVVVRANVRRSTRMSKRRGRGQEPDLGATRRGRHRQDGATRVRGSSMRGVPGHSGGWCGIGDGAGPLPQREALETTFSFSSGAPPDRLFEGLALLSLLSEHAEAQPLVCLVDDVQWLDRSWPRCSHSLQHVSARSRLSSFLPSATVTTRASWWGCRRCGCPGCQSRRGRAGLAGDARAAR